MKTSELFEGLTFRNGKTIGIFYYDTDFRLSEDQCKELGPEIKEKCKVSGWRGDVTIKWRQRDSQLAQMTDDPETLERMRKRAKQPGVITAEAEATGNARNDAAMSKFIHEFLQAKFPEGKVKRIR